MLDSNDEISEIKETSKDASNSVEAKFQSLASNKDSDHSEIIDVLKSENEPEIERKTSPETETETSTKIDKGSITFTKSIESDEEQINNNKQLKGAQDKENEEERSGYAFASASSSQGPYSTSFAQANALSQGEFGSTSPYGIFSPNSASSSAQAYGSALATASVGSSPYRYSTFVAPPSPYPGFGSYSSADAIAQGQADYNRWDPFMPRYVK